ncbi:MAG: hypothetical protein K2N74_01425, partial [Clostridiales bacterium]|nr:hypothetical protein [Clostridiales bacterium]
SFSAGVFVVCSHTFGESKTAKLLLLLLLPWTGAVLVLLWRETNAPLTPTFSGTQPFSLTEKIQSIASSLGGFGACTARDSEYFPTGREMFSRLLADLEGAEKTIFLEYYIVERGTFWNEILAVLEQKAKQGVAVKVILDGFGCCLTLPRNYGKQLKSRGIECRVYRPLRFPTRSAQKRDHRKLAVIDGEIAYTGGVNLADEYIGEKIRFGHWKDTAIRVTGSAASELQRLFLKQWDGRTTNLPARDNEQGAPCVVFADDERPTHVGAAVLTALIYGAKKRLYLCTPYLAPDTTVLAALKTAAASGTDVRICIPHVPDKKTVFRLSLSYARELIKSGVQIREYTAGFMHAKNVTADGVYCVVSSYNLDFRSLYLQSECGVFLEDERLAADMERDFLSVWSTGSELKEPTTFERITGKILRLFAPLI